MRNPCVSLVLSILILIGLAASEAALAQRADFSFWTQIGASAPTASARFGYKAHLSGDGSTALVSALQGDCSVSPCAPATYVFVRDRGTWIQQAELSSPGNPPGETNLSTAISGDGNTVFLGIDAVNCAAGSRCGAVYVYSRNGTDWTLQQTLMASDPKALGYFGVDVALSEDGGTALVSSIGASCGLPVSSCGAVYVFTRAGSVWTERQKLLEPVPNTYFGRSVALSADGNTALAVGGFDFGAFSGRIYVFTRSGDVWSVQDTILPPPGAADFASAGVVVSGDGSVILARGDNDAFAGGGTVFVFARTGGAWSQEAALTGVSALEDFGGVFDLTDDGQTALIRSGSVGCPPGSPCGTADVFLRNGGAWNRVQRFSPPGSAQNYPLGSVVLSGDGTTALLGVPEQPCAAGAACGAAYLFTNAPLAVGIPTLGGAGIALLTLLLVASALVLLQRRRSL